MISFYLDMIPVILAVYALIKLSAIKVKTITIKLAKAVALLLIICQTTWIQSYLKGFDMVVSGVDLIWTLFNSLVMLLLISLASAEKENAKNC